METVKKVLEAYSIQSININQITENLFKINDGHHSYALKKSMLTKNEINAWENVFHQAYSLNLTEILPIYLTHSGYLYEKMNDAYFYLMPWIVDSNEEEKHRLEQLYQSIGMIHAKTQKSQSIDSKKAIQTFENYRKTCQEFGKKMVDFVEQFEKNRYMSPFELLVCTHYRDISFVLMKMDSCIDTFITELEGQSEWNYCLCHGQLDTSHMLQHQQTYIINWEKAHHDNAIMDLSVFFTNYVTDYDQPTEEMIDLFPVYMEKNKLSNCELNLLSIYLLDPKNYIAIIQDYIDHPPNMSMIDRIKTLQIAHRKLSYAIEWSQNVEKLNEPVPSTDVED